MGTTAKADKRERVAHAMERLRVNGGNVRLTARELGMSHVTLLRWAEASKKPPATRGPRPPIPGVKSARPAESIPVSQPPPPRELLAVPAPRETRAPEIAAMLEDRLIAALKNLTDPDLAAMPAEKLGPLVGVLAAKARIYSEQATEIIRSEGGRADDKFEDWHRDDLNDLGELLERVEARKLAQATGAPFDAAAWRPAGSYRPVYRLDGATDLGAEPAPTVVADEVPTVGSADEVVVAPEPPPVADAPVAQPAPPQVSAPAPFDPYGAPGRLADLDRYF